MTRMLHVTTAMIALGASAQALGGFTVIKGFDAWSAAAGPSIKLDFVFSEPQVLSNQYEMFGVTFLPNGTVAYPSGSFQQDGWGIKNLFPEFEIRMKFDQPVYAIGAWFPGDLFAKLYWQGELIYASPTLFTFPLFYAFGGITSSQPFDEVVFYDTDTLAAIDDIYFSTTPIPNPGAVALGVIATLAAGRRRRR